MQRRHFLQSTAATTAAALMLPGLSQAQPGSPAGTWPAKPLRIIVPFTPGGTTDLVARLVGTELGKSLGQPVIVENKPGAGTVIGVDYVSKQPADGYTLVCVANSFTANKTLVKNLPYDTTRDLKPVALMGLSEHVLATHPGSGLKTLADLRSRAKVRPGELSYASFGNGTSAHLSGALLCQEMGIEMVHIPYKGGAPALQDLLGGRVASYFSAPPTAMPHVETGRLVPLATTGLKRPSYLPNIPTVAESGYPGFEALNWYAFVAPGKTPAPLLDNWNREIVKVLEDPEVKAALDKHGLTPQPTTRQGLADFIRSESDKWAQVVRERKITAN